MGCCQLCWACCACINISWNMYSFSVWYNLYCKIGKGGKIVLIETRIYKCEYCGAEWHGYEDPFRQTEVEDYEHMYIDDVWKLIGLWWFDPDLYYGEWVRVDDQIKRWTDIKNKFVNNA